MYASLFSERDSQEGILNENPHFIFDLETVTDPGLETQFYRQLAILIPSATSRSVSRVFLFGGQR
jgi:hypothetical protein